MANFDTGFDVLTNVLSRAEELGIGLSDREVEAKAYIQASYISVLSEGYPWRFGLKNPPAALTTLAEYTTGSITVVNASPTITFSVAPAISMAGRKFFVETDPVVYRITAHTAASTTATLDSNYIGSNASGAAFKIYQDEYTLASDFLRPVTKNQFLRRQDGFGYASIVSLEEMEGNTAARVLWSGTDVPKQVAFIGDKRIKISPWTTLEKRFEYRYIYHPGVLTFDAVAGTDTLIIQPSEDRVVVALMAIGNLLVDKNDDRASIFLDAAVSKISAMKRLQNTLTRNRIWVAPGNNVATKR